MLKKWWHSLIGEPVITIDFSGEVDKKRLKRLGPLLRIYNGWKWVTVNPDGTGGVNIKNWYYRNSRLPYNPQGIVDSILKTKEILPVLMGIDPELDKLIEQELKK
jgi:hypothetical protein